MRLLSCPDEGGGVVFLRIGDNRHARFNDKASRASATEAQLDGMAVGNEVHDLEPHAEAARGGGKAGGAFGNASERLVGDLRAVV